MISNEDSVDPNVDLKEKIEESEISNIEKQNNQIQKENNQEIKENNLPKTNELNDSAKEEEIKFKVIYNKKSFDLSFPPDESISNLKIKLEQLTEVPVEMQKLMFKGRMNDSMTLKENKVIPGSRLMLIGSTMNQVKSVEDHPANQKPQPSTVADVSSKEPLSKQKPHKTILEKYGIPDDLMPGILGMDEGLPPFPLSGMYNKSGGKVRLTFKLEADQLWIGTKERTEKVNLGSIKSVANQPIHHHQTHHIIGLQLGSTEGSRYWIYWVPCQYIKAIKDTILGGWQLF